MSSPTPLPDRIGRYVDCKLLGQGGMGQVWRARDPELDRPVAIKVMLDQSPDFVERFRREAQSIARLCHPHIVQVYDFGVDEQGSPYFVMELINGRALDKVIEESGPLPPLDVVRLARQAADGLSAAHSVGLVHRDIKPSNLVVDDRGLLKIVDFGIARIVDADKLKLTGAASLLGTPGYMAPEQAEGRPIDGRADIYALGLTLFELVAGEPPYVAGDAISLVLANLREPLPDLRKRGVPAELAQLIEQMGRKDPNERLQSCAAVMAALDEVERELGGPEAARPAITRPRPLAGQRRAPVVSEDAMSATFAATPAPTPLPSVAKTDDAAGTAALPSERSSASSRPMMPLVAVLSAVVVVAVGFFVLRNRLPGMNSGGSGGVTTLQVATPLVPSGIVPPTLPTAHAPTPQTIKTPNGPVRVAVLRFKNVGDDAALHALADGLPETAVSALGATGTHKRFQLIERADLESDMSEIDRSKDVHFDRATVAQLGKLEGVELAVQGGFQRAGSQVRVTARVVRVENGEILATLAVDGKANDPFALQDSVARVIGDKLNALPEAAK